MENKRVIYLIKNKTTEKIYVGSTSRGLKARSWYHISALRRNKHHNKHLQRAWNKYGEQDFFFKEIESVNEKDSLLLREQYWMDFYKSYEIGYNMCRDVFQSRIGLKASPETLKKMSESMSKEKHPLWGKKMSKTWIRNMKKAVTGIKKPNSGHKKTYKVLSPTNEVIEFIGLRKFCRENNLSVGCFCNVLNGKLKQHKGWRNFNASVI